MARMPTIVTASTDGTSVGLSSRVPKITCKVSPTRMPSCPAVSKPTMASDTDDGSASRPSIIFTLPIGCSVSTAAAWSDRNGSCRPRNDTPSPMRTKRVAASTCGRPAARVKSASALAGGGVGEEVHRQVGLVGPREESVETRRRPATTGYRRHRRARTERQYQHEPNVGPTAATHHATLDETHRCPSEHRFSMESVARTRQEYWPAVWKWCWHHSKHGVQWCGTGPALTEGLELVASKALRFYRVELSGIETPSMPWRGPNAKKCWYTLGANRGCCLARACGAGSDAHAVELGFSSRSDSDSRRQRLSTKFDVAPEEFRAMSLRQVLDSRRYHREVDQWLADLHVAEDKVTLADKVYGDPRILFQERTTRAMRWRATSGCYPSTADRP